MNYMALTPLNIWDGTWLTTRIHYQRMSQDPQQLISLGRGPVAQKWCLLSRSLVVGSARGAEEEGEAGGGGGARRLPVTLLTALWKIAVLAERGGAAARLHALVSPREEASWAEQIEVTEGEKGWRGVRRSWLAQHAALDERFRLSVKTLNAVSVIITCSNWWRVEGEWELDREGG